MARDNAYDALDTAQEEALANVAQFTAWLAGQCEKATKVKVPFESRHGDVDYDEETIPRLVRHMTYSSIEVAGWAMYELRARFLAEFARPIEARAAEIEAELDAADAEPDPDAWHDAKVEALTGD